MTADKCRTLQPQKQGRRKWKKRRTEGEKKGKIGSLKRHSMVNLTKSLHLLFDQGKYFETTYILVID